MMLLRLAALTGDLVGGAAAAEAIGLAAKLVVTAARGSHDWPDAGGTVAQAQALRARCAQLADEDAAAFRDALAHPAADTLARSVDVPLRIAEAAVDAALLAEATAARCEGNFRGDAAAAAVLAEAAARIVEHLVEINLGVGSGDDRLAQARLRVQAAAEAAARALDTEH
jgi:formiminotetrahydrofolate cyclodeaminase